VCGLCDAYEEPERRWWAYGDYVAGECPMCHRERMMVCEDNAGQPRVICEKCAWEPDANGYCVEAIGN
jgi:hypothetical protein